VVASLVMRKRLLLLVPAAALALLAAWVFWPRALRLDDLASDPVPWLFRLPGVVKVERSGPRKAARRVVHVLNYHDLPDDLARADGHDPAELNATVDLVQAQQALLLKALLSRGVKAVHLEGLTPNGLKAWEAKVGAAAEAEGLLAGLREQAARVRPGVEADPVLARVRQMQRGHEAEVRRLGALAVLACSGVRVDALPLDDEVALEAATPRLVDGRPVIDAKLWRARQEAMVRLLPGAGLAVIVLGAGHDLGPVLGDGTEYIRVEVAAVREALRE
jgi:hypothetical protein